jgi:phage repressor protein C with HTH and peptisase S24 domain
MRKLKHSSTLKSKHYFLFLKMRPSYNRAMLINKEEKEKRQLILRLKEAIASMGRGGKSRIARECGISPTALTGWLKTGSIDKKNIEILSRLSGYRLEWLITGKGEKLKVVDIMKSSTDAGNGHKTSDLGDFIKVPIVGNAQLGDDGYWCELEYPVGHGDGYIKYAVRDKNAYALRCVGDSMKPRIRDGEFVIVEPSYAPQPGDDVMVKSVDGRVMVKTYLYTRDDRVHLMSINEAHPPQSFALHEIEKMHPVAGIANKLAFVK